MTRSDDKFAWRKTHAINARIETWLRNGEPIHYDSLVRATQAGAKGDASMVSFATGSAGGEKGSYVVFQYGILIQDGDGRYATFQRIEDDKGFGRRNLSGSSVLVSGSRMMKPSEALESVLNGKLSFGRKASPGAFEPLGFALRREHPLEGLPRADYLFCLYRLRLKGNRLNGLLRDNPDSFDWWRSPAELLRDGVDGPVDELLLRALSQRRPKPHLEGDVWYQPRSRLLDVSGKPLPVARFDVPACRTVFISHDAAAQLKAFLLRDVLVKRSRQRLFPFLDMHDVFPKTGSFWPRIESMIERSDVFLVLVTRGTAKSKGVRREIAYWKKLRPRPELVVLRIDGTPQDVPSGLRTESIHDYTGRTYRPWHSELDGLVEMLVSKRYRAGSDAARDPY